MTMQCTVLEGFKLAITFTLSPCNSQIDGWEFNSVLQSTQTNMSSYFNVLRNFLPVHFLFQQCLAVKVGVNTNILLVFILMTFVRFKVKYLLSACDEDTLWPTVGPSMKQYLLDLVWTFMCRGSTFLYMFFTCISFILSVNVRVVECGWSAMSQLFFIRLN